MEKRILLYKKKSDINKKSKEATINLMTSLSDISWRQIEHPVDKASEAEDGFMMFYADLEGAGQDLPVRRPGGDAQSF